MAARTIHPFPARMAPEIALNCIPVASHAEGKRILDPMCGSGTVLSVATQRGHHATGVDMDPLAVLMSRVATTSIKGLGCGGYHDQIIKRAKADREIRLPWEDEETRSFAEFWFAKEQRIDLARLSRSIDQITVRPIRALAQISLSRTIITKAPKASLAADTSHSRPHRVRSSSDYDVFAGFSQAFTNLNQLLESRNTLGNAKVHLGDCRSLDCVSAASIDLVITSPPYLNAIDYMRGHKLALIWLGYTIPELRAIRSSSIGAERSLAEPAESETDTLVNYIADVASDPTRLPIPILRRYAHDLLLFSQQMARVLRPSSKLVAVVGNSMVRGNFIRNDVTVEKALQVYGFTTQKKHERLLPDNKRYLPIKSTSSSSITRRMRTETILHMTAPA